MIRKGLCVTKMIHYDADDKCIASYYATDLFEIVNSSVLRKRYRHLLAYCCFKIQQPRIGTNKVQMSNEACSCATLKNHGRCSQLANLGSYR
jgi:hypothetical protein